MLYLGIAVAVVLLAAFVALYVKVRRFERDVDVPTRELSDQEKHARMVEGSAAANIIGSVSGGNGF